MATYHTVDGQPYAVTAGTDVTVTDADGLVLSVAAGGQGSFVGNGGDVEVTGDHHFVQVKGGFAVGGGGGGGEPFDGNLPDNDLRVGELGGDKKIYLNGLEIMQESTVIVDVVEANNANAVTSNAVFNALQDVPSPLVPGDGISIGDDNVISVDTSGGEVVSGNTLPVSGDAVNGALGIHKEDTSLHKSVAEQAQLTYLIENYGKRTSLPEPVPHPIPYDPEEPQDEGEWTYQSDSVLQAAGYFNESSVLKYDNPSMPNGRWPVYGLLLPWYNQLDGTYETGSEFYDRSSVKPWDESGAESGSTYSAKLPDIAVLGQDPSTGLDVKSPWLFDSLIYDPAIGRRRPRRWRPTEWNVDGSGAKVAGVDEWHDGLSTDMNDHGEQLWKWYDVNYVRCDNGNRRIAAIRGEAGSGFVEHGDVDVGVAFDKRYVYCGRVQCYSTEKTKWIDYMLLLIAGGPMSDPLFDTSIKSLLTDETKIRGMAPSGDIRQSIELKLWKECQRYSYNELTGEYDISPGIYGLHSKYQSVLGGSSLTGRLPRSQRGHILNSQSYSTLAYNASNSINDGVAVYDPDGTKRTAAGYPNYIRKGPGYKGGGMDRMLFIGLHLMMKGGSKDTQLYLRGVVDSIDYSTTCAVSTADAREAGVVPETVDDYYGYVVIPNTAKGNFPVGRWLALGSANSKDFTSAKYAFGQIVANEDIGMVGSKNCNRLYVHLWEDFGLKSITHNAGDYVNVMLPPSGCTDVIGVRDGTDVSCTASPSSTCRFFGTEYGVGAWNINMDTHVYYDSTTGASNLHLYYAGPQRTRQRTRDDILNYHTDLTPNGFGHTASWYGGDLVVDIDKGVYWQTKPGNGTGSTSYGLRDQVYRDGATTYNDMRMYCAFGGSIILTGSSAGVWGVSVYGSYNTGLTSAGWYSCSCD